MEKVSIKYGFNLSNIDFSSIHELQNGCQMLEWNIFEDDDWMFGRILFQQVLEVGTAGTEDHLVGLGVLSLGGDGDVTEGLLVSQMLE